ncbi:unnamed protein product [Closterium sp. Naga37s-1]|nr:unnamed protein product [Closterium sp. Naga37s-1]
MGIMNGCELRLTIVLRGHLASSPACVSSRLALLSFPTLASFARIPALILPIWPHAPSDFILKRVYCQTLVAGPTSPFQDLDLVIYHYDVDFSPALVSKGDLVIYHYDVDFSPALASKGVMRAAVRQLAETYSAQLVPPGGAPSAPALDVALRERLLTSPTPVGRSLYSASLGSSALSSPALLAHPALSPLSPLSLSLQALDVALRERLLTSLTPVGRSLYSASLGSSALGGGVAAYRGFFQSVRFSQQGLAALLALALAGLPLEPTLPLSPHPLFPFPPPFPPQRWAAEESNSLPRLFQSVRFSQQGWLSTWTWLPPLSTSTCRSSPLPPTFSAAGGGGGGGGRGGGRGGFGGRGGRGPGGGGGGGGGFAPNASLSDGERVKLKRALHGIKWGWTHRDTPRRGGDSPRHAPPSVPLLPPPPSSPQVESIFSPVPLPLSLCTCLSIILPPSPSPTVLCTFATRVSHSCHSVPPLLRPSPMQLPHPGPDTRAGTRANLHHRRRGRDVLVAYFRSAYGYTIRHPNLPCPASDTLSAPCISLPPRDSPFPPVTTPPLPPSRPSPLCSYRIQGLTREPAHALTFTIEGEGETSLVAYFRSAYGYTIRHPNLPCVMAGGGGKSFLPMEVVPHHRRAAVTARS